MHGRGADGASHARTQRAWLCLTVRFAAMRVRLALQKHDKELKAMYQVLSGHVNVYGYQYLLCAALDELAKKGYVKFVSKSGDKRVSAAAGCCGCGTAAPLAYAKLREPGGKRMLILPHPASSCSSLQRQCMCAHGGVGGVGVVGGEVAAAEGAAGA